MKTSKQTKYLSLCYNTGKSRNVAVNTIMVSWNILKRNLLATS